MLCQSDLILLHKWGLDDSQSHTTVSYTYIPITYMFTPVKNCKSDISKILQTQAAAVAAARGQARRAAPPRRRPWRHAAPPPLASNGVGDLDLGRREPRVASRLVRAQLLPVTPALVRLEHLFPYLYVLLLPYP